MTTTLPRKSVAKVGENSKSDSFLPTCKYVENFTRHMLCQYFVDDQYDVPPGDAFVYRFMIELGAFQTELQLLK